MADPGSEVEFSQGGADRLRIEEADCRCQLSKFDDVTGSNEMMKKALLHDRLGRILYGQVSNDNGMQHNFVHGGGWVLAFSCALLYTLPQAYTQQEFVVLNLVCFRQSQI